MGTQTTKLNLVWYRNYDYDSRSPFHVGLRPVDPPVRLVRRVHLHGHNLLNSVDIQPRRNQHRQVKNEI